MISNVVESVVSREVGEKEADDEAIIALLNNFAKIIPLESLSKEEVDRDRSRIGLINLLKEKAFELYAKKEADVIENSPVALPTDKQVDSDYPMRELERIILLRVIDSRWMNHIDDMDQLRQGINLVAYGQKDPVVEYKMAAYDMFDAMTNAINEETVRMLFHVQVARKVERKEVAKVTGTNHGNEEKIKQVIRTDKKIYPNDPCPCGSGKKYKNCHGKQG